MLRAALPGCAILTMCTVLLAAVLCERWRYRSADDAGDAMWQETAEQFIDPQTGTLTQVLYRPATAERRYVAVAAKRGEDG